VTGSLDVSGTSITQATFTADMTKVSSVNQNGDVAGARAAQRDRQFQGRIMQTSTYPTATFQLTEPIAFSSVPPQGSVQNKTATGKLTLHGVTKDVTFAVKCERNGNTAQVNGSIPITFADYNIQNPSFGFVRTEDHGLLEFTLNLRHE
jgi:polyisoprenoid-binding protein YceI